jgi:Helix-turn-helix domain
VALVRGQEARSLSQWGGRKSREVGDQGDADQEAAGGCADRLWTVHDVSAFLGVPVGTLYQWRYLRIGPPAYRVGRHIRYDPAAVRTWLSAQDAYGR